MSFMRQFGTLANEIGTFQFGGTSAFKVVFGAGFGSMFVFAFRVRRLPKECSCEKGRFVSSLVTKAVSSNTNPHPLYMSFACAF
jgi:hypothetical protein